MKAKVFPSNDICMHGKELRRLRRAANLSERGLARKMTDWGWYRDKVRDFEKMHQFCLDRKEMQALLIVLGVE